VIAVRALRLWPAMAVVVVAGCTAAYFQRAEAPPAPTRIALEALPWRDVWMGLVFNGEKIGYSHLGLRSDPRRPGGWRICAEAALRFRFLVMDKSVSLSGCDRVDGALRVQGFAYRLDVDRSRMEIRGEVQGDVLRLHLRSDGQERHETLPLSGPLLPVSAINLVPVVRGLHEGALYRYTVYSAETRALAEVEQRVVAWEESELFEGPAWRVETRMLGQSVTTWIDAQGRPQLEISLGGVLIAGLESERQARRYVVEAALSKRDVLLDLSRVPAQPPIARPREARGLDLVLEGLGGLRPPSNGWQRCAARDGAVRCRIGSLHPGGVAEPPPDPARHLASSWAVPARDPRIRDLAREVAGGRDDPETRVRRLLDWIGRNIEPAAEDSFSALDVLRTRRAECQGHAALFAALARSLGIPVQVVNGLVYSAEHDGFLFHTWTRVWLGDRWVPVDPIFGQFPADATHVELLGGEEPAALLPLAGIVGHVRARILAVDAAGGAPETEATE
jgi:hypothetical protein